MIVPRDELASILRGDVGEAQVQGAAPEVGATFWVRPSPKQQPVCQAEVVDCWEVGSGGHSVLLKRVQGPVLPRRPSSPRPAFTLSREQRQQLLGEDYRPLVFDAEPDCEPAERYVLLWSRATKVHDGDRGNGKVTAIPREPLLWISIESKSRRADGKWALRYRVEDRRHKPRLLAAVIDTTRPEPDYTSDPAAAQDLLEAMPSEYDSMTPYQAIPRAPAPREEQRAVSLGRRLDVAIYHAKSKRVDASDRLRRVKREIELLERDLAG